MGRAHALGRMGLALALGLIATPAWSQPVTFADLQGATIEAVVVMQQLRRSGGQTHSGESRQTWRTVIGPGDTIQSTSSTTASSPRGTRTSAPRTGSFTLGKPRAVSDLGGGDAVWVFTNGTLNYLRTYRGAGGYKRTFTFARRAGGLTCTVRTAFARESGVGDIELESPVSGSRVEILSSKQVSSSCRVSK
jgi:hypothetical protein